MFDSLQPPGIVMGNPFHFLDILVLLLDYYMVQLLQTVQRVLFPLKLMMLPGMVVSCDDHNVHTQDSQK